MSTKKTRNENVLLATIKPGVLAVSALLIFLVGVEIFNLAWGSGHFAGRLSLKWISILGFYSLFAIGLLVLLYVGFFTPTRLNYLRKSTLTFRKKIGRVSWMIILAFAVLPAYFVFYSPWGGLFTGFFTRFFLFCLVLAPVSFFLATKNEEVFSWRSILLAGLLVGSLLALAESFVLVSSYPFALHWSEGNRLWDYSVLFGRGRYNYPTNEPIFAWIDSGRQALWGLPFLFPSLTICAARLWGAFLTTIPFALLGLFAFRPLKNARGQWLMAGVWTLIFLNQGPIYTPLIFAAILVAAARRRPIWWALPLVYLAGLYAGSSRFTWAFAPAIWAVMLTFSDGVLLHRHLVGKDWLRATALGLAGIWAKGLPVLSGLVRGFLPISLAAQVTPTLDATPGAQGITTLQGLQATATGQPFIWYRLLPNDVYPPGILLGLALATLPLILLLVYLARHRYWKTVPWQRVTLGSGLFAFLLVGVIASAKVGGGGDLHNLDMFLISLVLLAGVAWEAGFYKQLSKFLQGNGAVRWLLAGTILIPTLVPMVTGKPLVLPSAQRTHFVLQQIQDKVACARQHGEVLFMDQRQLLTFGQMGDLPLVVDYEKKFVMDQALAANKAYFDQFDTDLAASRFSLIVSEREGTLFKELDQGSIGDSLVEENNAWVHWVGVPLLTYYESVGNYKDAAIELFVPIERNFDCP